MFVLLIAVSGVGLNYILKYNFPNYYNQLGVSLMYQIIYYYSSVEMLYLKFYKYKTKQTIKIQDSTNIEFVKNGKTIKGEDYDFIIYSQNNEKKIMNNAFDKITCVKSDVSFILFNIVMNNTTISLNLFGNNYNYYVSGNVIDNRFLWYFLNKHYNLNLTEPLINYTLNIIDNNVNIYAITYPEHFEITNDGIRIISHECQKITNNMIFDDFSEKSDTMSETTLLISDILTNVMLELEEKLEEPKSQEEKEPSEYVIFSVKGPTEINKGNQIYTSPPTLQLEIPHKHNAYNSEVFDAEPIADGTEEIKQVYNNEKNNEFIESTLPEQEDDQEDQVDQEEEQEEDQVDQKEDQEKEGQVEQKSQEAHQTEDNDIYDFVKETI
jgi:hypothetical protein